MYEGPKVTVYSYLEPRVKAIRECDSAGALMMHVSKMVPTGGKGRSMLLDVSSVDRLPLVSVFAFRVFTTIQDRKRI